MAALTFDDLLSGDSRVRSGVVDVKGVGHVHMHELTIAEYDKIKQEAEGKTDEEIGELMATWALRMVKGSTPSKAELKKACERYSPTQMAAIYFAGMSFNLVDSDSKEAIEKN